MIASFFVAAGGDNSTLHRADACLEIEPGCQRLGWKLCLTQMRQEPFCVQEDRVSANGLYKRDSQRREVFADIFDLSNSGADMIELDGFRNSAGHGFHVSSGESSIGVKTLVKHNHIPGFLKEIPIIERQESSDIHQEILFSRHGATIGVGAKFMKNLGDSVV